MQTELPGHSGAGDDLVNAGYVRTMLRQVCTGDIRLSSLRISLLVGSLLNLVNQGGYWLHGDGLHMGHLVLNYIVPFCVAGYSAVRTRMKDIGVVGNTD